MVLPVLRHASFLKKKFMAIMKEYYEQFKVGVTSLLQQNSARMVMKSETNNK